VQAERAAAQEAERRRLGRVVHDGVLQVLAQVARRGPELGPDGQALAEAAAEQEIALRRLVSAELGPQPPLGSPTLGVDSGPVDLAAMLDAHTTSTVTVSPPAEPVWVHAHLATETNAAVAAALDNVKRHAPNAHAWVLLEDEGDSLHVTVRDNGPGMMADRLPQARSEGRLGVRESIIGRVEDLGGTATVTSREGSGVVVQMVIPRGSHD
jgi:signal transduction histidine kinase